MHSSPRIDLLEDLNHIYGRKLKFLPTFILFYFLTKIIVAISKVFAETKTVA